MCQSSMHGQGWGERAGEVLDPVMLSKLRAELGEDAALVAQVFLERLTVRMLMLRQAVADGDGGRVKETAHLLKGSSRQMGALPMGRVAEALEQASNQQGGGMAERLTELEQLSEVTALALRREFELP